VELEKLLDNGQAAAYPTDLPCDGVFAVIDTASKTGSEPDVAAGTYFATNVHSGIRLMILDWHIAQIEGATLETWLPSVFNRLEELRTTPGLPEAIWLRLCRHG
jgi:hypothetical protein